MQWDNKPKHRGRRHYAAPGRSVVTSILFVSFVDRLAPFDDGDLVGCERVESVHDLIDQAIRGGDAAIQPGDQRLATTIHAHHFRETTQVLDATQHEPFPLRLVERADVVA